MTTLVRADPAAGRLEFVLPEVLEAREPPEARGLSRDGVRLLVSSARADRIVHARFTDLPAFLRSGDLLVVNVSATIPAALTARRADGTEVALHVSTRLPADLVIVEFRNAALSAGETVALPDGGSAAVLAPYPRSSRLWVARLTLPEALPPYLSRWGRPVTYRYVRGRWPIEMYQNVYASVPGSAEMPSAGRAFTPRLLDRLSGRGVEIVPVLLHTGVASLEHDEAPYEEYFEVSHEAASTLGRARRQGRRVIAVGTTAVRAVESALDAAGRPIASRGWTDLVITPDRGVHLVGGLLTGFHEPRATHLSLLQAFAGPAHLDRAYHEALEAGYLWHEFGDLHLILPD
ncbi:MAG TPA: S-adenosylmethionine:tRNA ribosyltransferase-isomerase [bacterium]|nr:S-adenosylmethionine:tRNA ribosyltransferase-isomerase [bacterium]